MRNQRDRREPNRRVVHVTNRVWTGLPFVPNIFINRMLRGVIARGQHLYPVTICGLMFMGNHYHMVICGRINLLSAFMGYVDGEIAKRLQRLYPKRFGPKVWEGRYKEQHLPTPEAVINKLVYLFRNPLRANLESCLRLYPGVNSSTSLETSDYCYSKLCSFTLPRYFKAFKGKYLSRSKAHALCRELEGKRMGFHELRVELLGWVRCFGRDEVCGAESVRTIRLQIEDSEAELKGQPVVGRARLENMSLYRKHEPEKRGSTPFIDCPDSELRKELIKSYKDFREGCRAAWVLIKRGIEAVWPRGAIVPSWRWRELARGLGESSEAVFVPA